MTSTNRNSSNKSGTTTSNLLTQLINLRQSIPPKRPEIYDRACRSLVTKCYKRTTPRKVFKTKPDENNINPIYDIKYSPVVYPDYRVVAVGDELGYLSLVRVRVDGENRRPRRRRSKEPENDGGVAGVNNKDLELTENAMCSIPYDQYTLDYDDPYATQPQPVHVVLYSVAWNSTGDKVLAGYGDGSLKVWDFGSNNKDQPVCTYTSRPYDKSIKRVAWGGGGGDSTIVSCSRTNQIIIHDTRMRNHLVNSISCDALRSKLSDISVVHPYILSCSSNQSQVMLWDMRMTYKLYRRVSAIESFNLGSPGYTNMVVDNEMSEKVFALGSDSKIRSLNWRSGACGRSYRVPGGVDFFSKIDVDCVGDVLVSGGGEASGFGFDLTGCWEGAGDNDRGVLVEPFWELNSSKVKKRVNDDDDDEEEKKQETQQQQQQQQQPNDDKENEVVRCCCAVAIGNRRGVGDGFVQVATGGDDSIVTIWD